MYKWVHYSDIDIQSQIHELRKKYNTPTKTYYFKQGMYKDKSCIFVLNDLDTRVYSDPVESKQFKGDLFFGPANEFKIEDYEIHKEKREWKIKVDTAAGLTLYIIPASMEPKKIVFDFDDEEQKEDESPYSVATEYGRLAYSIFGDAENKKEILLNDKRVKKLVILALMKSYNIPIDVINAISLVSAQDLDPLLNAAMGVSEELLSKKNDGCQPSQASTQQN